MRQARRVVDDDRARGGEPRRPLARGPAAGREQRDVEARRSRRRRRAARTGRSPPSSSRPAERSEAKGTTSRAGKLALAQDREHRRADGAGGADHGDAVGRSLTPALRRERLLGLDVVRARARSLVQRPHGVAARARPRITQEILIGEVEIISMLISRSPSVRKTLAATPGWRLHARRRRSTPCPSRRRWRTSANELAAHAARARRAAPQVVARDGEGDVGPRALRARARSGRSCRR